MAVPATGGGTERTTAVYIAEQPRWEHTSDGSPCPDGLGIPLREWVSVDLPFRCSDGREIRMVPSSASPMWLDQVSVSRTGVPGAA